MLGIIQEYVRKIAEMPTQHSWARPLMMTDDDDIADQAEDMVANWIKKEMEKLYPSATYYASRMVRTVWLNLLEAEAIEKFNWSGFPSLYQPVPAVFSPQEAVSLANADINYIATDNDIEAATEFLGKMKAGELKPDVQKILKACGYPEDNNRPDDNGMPGTGGHRGKDADDTGHDDTKPVRPEDKAFIGAVKTYIDTTIGLDFKCDGELWYSPLSEHRNARPRFPERGRDESLFDMSGQKDSEAVVHDILPMYMPTDFMTPKEVFDCWVCHIENVKFLLLRQAEKKIRLNDLIQIIYQIELQPNTLCLLAKDTLKSEDRKTLIQHRISFVISGKQLYLLYIGLNIVESPGGVGGTGIPDVTPLTPAAQCMLLFHLQIRSLHNMNFSEIAELLHYSPKTISDAAEELEKHGLCDIYQRRDNMKSLQFRYNGLKLWDEAYPRLTAPIEKAAWMQKANSGDYQLLTSGDKAMQQYVKGLNIETAEFKLRFEMRMEERNCYAVSKRTEQGKLLSTTSVNIDYPNYDIIEFWKYDPEILARSEYVDPLSLVLCYRHNKDEAVQKQLRRIVETVFEKMKHR